MNKIPVFRFPGAKLVPYIGLNFDIFRLRPVEDDVG